MLVEQQLAMLVQLGNTMIKLERLIVKLIATLDHTLYLTKVHVSFVRKVSGKVKMDSQIAKIVDLGNTMIQLESQQRARSRQHHLGLNQRYHLTLPKKNQRKVDDIKNINMCQRSIKTRNGIVQNRAKISYIRITNGYAVGV